MTVYETMLCSLLNNQIGSHYYIVLCNTPWRAAGYKGYKQGLAHLSRELAEGGHGSWKERGVHVSVLHRAGTHRKLCRTHGCRFASREEQIDLAAKR
jgi:hypothetical protein